MRVWSVSVARTSKLQTTSLQQVKEQPKVKAFLDRKRRNSQNSASSYLLGLTWLQEFLNTTTDSSYHAVKLNELESLFNRGKRSLNVYEFLDAFVSYLTTNYDLSPNSIDLYVAAAKGYLEHCDIEINPTRFRNKVTMPRNHREDEAAIDD